MTKIRLLLLLFLISSFSLQTDAAMQTYNFKGTMSTNHTSLPIAVGDTFEGSFVFDSEPVLSGFTRNYFSRFEITISTASGALTFTAAPADAYLTDAAFDIFQINGVPSGLYDMGLVLQGGTAGYDSANLDHPLHFAGFSSKTVRLRETAGIDSRGNITSLTRADMEPPLSGLRFEYAAKIICGAQEDPSDMALARGLYATAINIRNTARKKISFTKTLALTVPPGEQKSGKVIPIAKDTLGAGQALEVDCNDVRKRVFDGKFPAPYIKGFIVLQSPVALDVTAVYTVGSLMKEASTGNNIDVESIPERIIPGEGK